MRRQTLQLLITLLITGIGALSCGSKEQAETQAKRFVKVEQLGRKQNSEELVFHGQLAEKKEVNIAFKVGGQVCEVTVDEGDYVTKGQIIAQIDPRDYKIRLQSAAAQYKQIEGEYARYKELYKKKKLPVNTLEKMEAGYLAAESAYEAAANALEDTELKAPFNGFVYRKKINKFENAAPGHTVYTLLDLSHLELHFSLPESKISSVGQFEDIRCDVLSAKRFDIPAKVLSVNEKSNGSDMYDVRLVMDKQKDNTLKPGMSAKVKVNLALTTPDAVVVPVEAVFAKGDKSYVWIYNAADSTVESHEVRIRKIENQGKLSVTGGLKGNEYVVTAGVYSLREKQAVKILENNLQ